MAAPLIPIIATALRALVGRAAVSAFGRAAVSTVAPNIGSRMIAAHAARQGATQATAGVATNAARQVAAAATPKPADGFVRLFHGGTPYDPIKDKGFGRWLTTDKKYAQGYATKGNSSLHYVDLPENHPELVKNRNYPDQWDEPHFKSSRGYNHFDSSPGVAAQLKPYHEGGPVAAGKSFSSIFSGYARQAGQWASSMASQSTLGQMYSSFRELMNYQPRGNDEPPRNRPNIIPVYPNLNMDQLSSLSGKSADEFAQANQDAGVALKRAEEEQRLLETTKKLNETFGRLMGLAWKMQTVPFLFSSATTTATGAMIDSQLAAGRPYDARFAMMAKQREIQDIRLSQRTSAATGRSAEVLNEANMQGRDSLNDVYNELRKLTNYGAAVLQYGANFAAFMTKGSLAFKALESINDIAEWWAGVKKEEEPVDVARMVLDEAIKEQQKNRNLKRPLKGVF